MKILKVVEKHSTLYYDVSTPEKLYSVCRKILLERLKAEYYEYDEELIKDQIDIKKETGLTEDDINELPDSYIKSKLIEHVDSAKGESRYHKSCKKLIEDINKLPETYNGYDNVRNDPAYRLLKSRSHAEYEEVELIELSDPNEYSVF